MPFGTPFLTGEQGSLLYSLTTYIQMTTIKIQSENNERTMMKRRSFPGGLVRRVGKTKLPTNKGVVYGQASPDNQTGCVV